MSEKVTEKKETSASEEGEKDAASKSESEATAAVKDDKDTDTAKEGDEGATSISGDASNTTTSEWLMGLMKRSMGLSSKEELPEQLLKTLDLEGVANYIASGKCKNIVTMAGAGISTSAGIPDFRSPDTGLYANLQKYNLPSPQAMFDISFFKENPEPFFQLAKELWPGIFKPTWCHYFIKLLSDKGLLLRHYSQNIDTLEHVAGIPPDKIVEAHGTFHTSHCITCNTEYSQEWIKKKIFADEVPHCSKDDCDSLVKPDIVFFGEALPPRFFQLVQQDMNICDLLIIMGTSLVVQPFASLTNRVPDKCPRLYINLEKAEGSADPVMALLGMGHGFRFDMEDNYRDVFWKGTCDDGCQKLAELSGWKKELDDTVKNAHESIEAKIQQEKKNVEKIKQDKSNEANSTESTKTKETDKSNVSEGSLNKEPVQDGQKKKVDGNL